MVGEGAVHAAIASAIGISVPTFRKAFSTELGDRLAGDNLFSAALDSPAPVSIRQRTRVSGKAGGAPEFRATDRQRDRVAVLISVGTTVADIAVVIGISEPTLRKHFATEIANGAAHKRAEVIEALYRNAVKGNVTAQRDYLDRIDRAQLAEIADQFRSQPEADRPRKIEPVGKKMAAAQDAAREAAEGGWSDILPDVGIARQTLQ